MPDSPLCMLTGGLEGWACSGAWLIMIVLFFLAAILKKQLFEGMLNMDFSVIGATILSEVLFIISLFIFHSPSWGFLIGLIGLFIGGIFGPSIFGGVEGGGNE